MNYKPSPQELLYRCYLKYQPKRKLFKRRQDAISMRLKRKNTANYTFLKQHFYDLYFNKEHGIKSLAKMYNLSYTDCRTFLFFLDIDIRTGKNVVTDRVRKLRSEKAIREKNAGSGFFDINLRRKNKTDITRGIQGYIYNEYKKEYSWIRSSYEYIFAKWLNRTKQNWSNEDKIFVLEDGRRYLPDFFIYDENDNLIKIVEIKGYWDRNSDKAAILNQILVDIDVVVIDDISQYIPEKSSFGKEKSNWKLERKINKDGKN